MNKKMTIAVDGPASSGKSTVSKMIAEDLGIIYIDTGAMYRALTYAALSNQVDSEDEQGLLTILDNLSIRFEREGSSQKVFANEEEVTDKIRSHEVTGAVSAVSAHPKVREEMVRRQQELAKEKSVIMDGRDIGTVVLPDADVKIFLVATVEERARRRYEENVQKGMASSLDEMIEQIKERDHKDSTRDTAPLKQAEDAHRVDTTGLSIPEVVKAIKTIIFN